MHANGGNKKQKIITCMCNRRESNRIKQIMLSGLGGTTKRLTYHDANYMSYCFCMKGARWVY